MSNFKLEFILKQHTPMIHFQSDQKGATLRATELKPKLDRFLIELFKREGIDYSSFLLVGEDKALDYKVTILTQENPIITKIDLFALDYKTKKIKKNRQEEQVTMPFPTFFATMGKEWKSNPKYFSFTDKKIYINIKTLNSDLRKTIEENFASFLAYTNFGTRQSKGFGSFYLDKDDERYISVERALGLKKSWSFVVQTNTLVQSKVDSYYPKYGEYHSLFEKIELLYKTLRSGINLKDRNKKTVFYFKSLLQNYMIDCDDYNDWDKAIIKAKFLDNEDKTKLRILSRDLLGLSTIHEYKSEWFTVRHPKKEDNQKKYPLNEVERFKSPIIFKPIKIEKTNSYKVYVTYQDKRVYSALLSKEILLLKEKNKKIEDSVKITLPSQFDLADFLDKSFSIEVDKHIKRYQKNHDKDYLEHFMGKDIVALYKSLEETK